MKKYIYLKYTIEFIFALVLFIIVLPLLGACALAIKIEDGGKVFFHQKRTGKNMKLFKCYKFRTMHTTDVQFDKNNPLIKGNNAHVTKVGRFLRKYKIDELPQLLNIIKGDMSFIAPRPLLPAYETDYEEWEKLKFLVRPGMTGLGQINGNGYLCTKDRNYYDVKYVMEMSFFKDIGIFFKTILVILLGEGKFIREVSSENSLILKNKAKAFLNLKKPEMVLLSDAA